MKIIFLLFLASVLLACTNVGFTTDCSNHGVCVFDQRIGGNRCACDSGYTGTICMDTVTTETSTKVQTAAPTAAPTVQTAAPTAAPTVAQTTVASVQTAAPTLAPVTTLLTAAPVTAAAPTVGPTRTNNTFCIDRGSMVDPMKAGKVCSGHGTCKNYDDPEMTPNTYCDCEPRFLGKYCEHDQKSKGVAAVLEFFFGAYGAGYFFLGINTLGILKLLLGIFGCCGACIGGIFFCVCAAGENERAGGAIFTCCGVIVCLMFTAASVWVTVTFIMILAGAQPDAQGFPLYDGFK